MTKQNRIHRQVRKYQQFRKAVIRHNNRIGYYAKAYEHHTRLWWKWWFKTCKAEALKETQNE